MLPSALINQSVDEGLGDGIDCGCVIDERSFEGGIVAEGHNATSRDVGQELVRPEEAAAVVGFVRPCVFRASVQSVQEDIAAVATKVVSLPGSCNKVAAPLGGAGNKRSG